MSVVPRKVWNKTRVQSRLGHTIASEDPAELFSLESRLGRGGFGAVYSAMNLKTNERVAIKIISIEDDEVIEDVRREVNILSECDNSHIVKYQGTYFKDENLWVRVYVILGGFITLFCVTRFRSKYSISVSLPRVLNLCNAEIITKYY
jgi:serine/threonine protein kinase